MAGACLFCVYSRARWSDFIQGGSIEFDRLSDQSIAYVEMQVTVQKTMFAAARRFRFLWIRGKVCMVVIGYNIGLTV